MNVSKTNLLFAASGGVILAAIITLVLIMGSEGWKQRDTAEDKAAGQSALQTAAQEEAESNTASMEPTGGETQEGNELAENPIPALANSQEIAQKISSLALEQKIAQLFIISPDSLTGVDNATVAGETTKNALVSYPVGGLIYKKGNLTDDVQTREMLTKSNDYSLETVGLPLIRLVDDKGGELSPFYGNSNYNIGIGSSPAELAASTDAYSEGAKLGGYIKALGFDACLAPSVDISNEAHSFGEDAASAAVKAEKFHAGIMSAGALAICADVPDAGEVSTAENGIELSEYDAQAAKQNAIQSFLPMLNGSYAISLCDAAYPGITSTVAPAFMSEKMVTELLTGELGYKGVIITPYLNKSNLTSAFSASEMTISAIEAGCDIILEPDNFYLSYEALLQSVRDGRISEERIDRSLSKILALKQAMAGL